MRCLSCNCNLSDYESTRKYISGGYIDLCNGCFNSVKDSLYITNDRQDLISAIDQLDVDADNTLLKGDNYD